VRVDPIIVVASAAVAGGFFAIAPWATGVGALAVLWLWRRSVSGISVALACACLAVGAARALSVPRHFEAELLRVRTVLGAPKRCAGLARVTRSPALRGGALGFVARFDEVDCEGTELVGAAARLYGGPADLARGDRVEIIADLAPIEMFKNAELPDPLFAAARAGVTLSGGVHAVRLVRRSGGLGALIDRWRAHVRERIGATFSRDAAPLARALVLGENDLTEGDAAAFRASGLAHLLAVSGTHLVFAIVGVVRAVAFVLSRIEALAARGDVGRYAAGAGVVLAPLYADFAGGSGSAWRAAWMLMVGLLARALGRRPSPGRSLALSMLTGAIVDPLVAFDISFLLSAAATAGLLVLGAPLGNVLLPDRTPRWLRFVGASGVATLAASLPCAPLLATLGPRLTLAGLVANVIAAPFGEVVSLPLCLVHAIAVVEPLERGIGLVASGALLFVRAVAHASANAAFLAFEVPPPGAWHFAVMAAGVAGVLSTRDGARPPSGHRRLLASAWALGALAGLCLVEAAAERAGHPRGVLRVTVVDVGQGDSTLIDLPNGALMLIDGGGMVGSPVDPGTSVLVPLIRARRRDRIDIAVLSHPHPDHFIGLASALREVPVGEFWDTGQGRSQGAGPLYATLIADLVRRGVVIRGPEFLCGGTRSLGGARAEVFAPCPAFDPSLGANDNSFVVRVAYRDGSALFMGDAEEAEEHALLVNQDLSADLLKVGHHGSRTSTSPALLRAVRPRAATISSGVRNRFGHPHPVTLESLRAAGVFALRTDRLGGIEWHAGSRAVRVFGATFRERTFARLFNPW
jgi:competence protein ComEC